jgi:hypothetical protein
VRTASYDKPAEQAPADDEWRRFAIEKYCDKLQTLDAISLKSEIRARRRSHRYWDYHRAKSFNLSGNKSELVKRLVDEAFAFLLSDDILYGDSSLVARHDESDLSPAACDDEDEDDASASEVAETSDSSSEAIKLRPSRPPKIVSKIKLKDKANNIKNAVVPLSESNFDSDDTKSDILVLSDSESCSSEPITLATPHRHDNNGGSSGQEGGDNRVESTERLAGAISRTAYMSVDRVLQLCFSFDDFKPGQR